MPLAANKKPPPPAKSIGKMESPSEPSRWSKKRNKGDQNRCGGDYERVWAILLLVAHDPALAAILFLVGAILSLYSLLDWLTGRDC